MANTKKVKIKTKTNRRVIDGYVDESRNLLFTQYITTELAAQCGWSWEEEEEQHGKL